MAMIIQDINGYNLAMAEVIQMAMGEEDRTPEGLRRLRELVLAVERYEDEVLQFFPFTQKE